MDILRLLAIVLSLFGYQITPISSCQVNGVFFDQRNEILYASVTDTGEQQTYVWQVDIFSLDAPSLEEVLPFTESFDFTDIAVLSGMDVFQAVADDDEVIFVVLDGQSGEATRHDLAVCPRG